MSLLLFFGHAADGTVSGTGDLDAQSAVVAGTAEREVTGEGTTDNLQAQSAAVAGTAEREVTDNPGSTVELVAQNASVAGTAVRVVTGTSSLASQAADADGAGTVTGAGTSGTGDLDAQNATVAGTAEREITAEGSFDNLQAQSAVVAGAGVVNVTITGTGVLLAQSAQIANQGEIYSTGSTVELQAQSSAAAGSGTVTASTNGGSLQARPAYISGAGQVGRWDVGTNDNLQAQSSAVAGTGTVVNIGGGTVTGTGALVARMGANNSGVLVSWPADITGTAERELIAVGSTVELQAQTATIVGIAFKSNFGQLRAQSAAVAGSGTVGSVGTSFGHLQAQSATVAGTAEREVTGTGVLEAQNTPPPSATLVSGFADLTGAGKRGVVSTSATLAAQSAQIAGAGTVPGGVGQLQAQSANVVGIGKRGVVNATLFVVLAAQAAQIAASGGVIDTIDAALVAQSASVAGTGQVYRYRTGSGVLQAQAADLDGLAAFSIGGTGTPTSQRAAVAGIAEREITATAALAAQSSQLFGAAGFVYTGSGELVPNRATLAGIGEREPFRFGTGTLQVDPAYISGIGEVYFIRTGTGALQSAPAEVDGTGAIVWTGTGSLSAASAALSASGAVGPYRDEYVLFSTEADTGVEGSPFYLVYTPDGTHVKIWVRDYGALAPCTTVLNPYETNQLGFKYWFSNGTHYWRYLINGVLDNTVSYTGAIRANVNALTRSLTVEHSNLPGWFDEVLFWRAGNTLSETDIYRAWQSYFSTPGFTSSVCGTLEVTLEQGDRYVIGFTDSVMGLPGAELPPYPVYVVESWGCEYVFVSEGSVYTFESAEPYTTIRSTGPDEMPSCRDD